MSGHSKWSTIKRQKGVNDAKRGQLFTKIGRELSVAVRHGGPDPESNFHLRLIVQKARENNMPIDNIDRAIKKASGKGTDNDDLHEVTYEGYGPGGAALILQAVTDNKNRTVAEVRSTLTRNGGNLGESGSVAWNFDSKGIILVGIDKENSEQVAAAANQWLGRNNNQPAGPVIEKIRFPDSQDAWNLMSTAEDNVIGLAMFQQLLLELGEDVPDVTTRDLVNNTILDKLRTEHLDED